MSAFAPFKQATPRIDAGYRPSVASGLLVPVESSRGREVWPRDEWRLLERATRMLGRHGIDLILQCQHPDCATTPLEPMRLDDGGFQLRCAHMDHVMTKAF